MNPIDMINKLRDNDELYITEDNHLLFLMRPYKTHKRKKIQKKWNRRYGENIYIKKKDGKLLLIAGYDIDKRF